MFFDSDKPYLHHYMQRIGKDNLSRLMVWLCLAGFWIAVAWVVML